MNRIRMMMCAWMDANRDEMGGVDADGFVEFLKELYPEIKDWQEDNIRRFVDKMNNEDADFRREEGRKPWINKYMGKPICASPRREKA